MFNNVIGENPQKWKIKKSKAKYYYRVNKEELGKRSREYYGKISVDDKIKKWNYANIRNKNMSDGDRETKKRMYARLLLLLNC